MNKPRRLDCLDCPQCGSPCAYRFDKPTLGVEVTCVACGRAWFPFGGDPEVIAAQKAHRQRGRGRKAFVNGYTTRRS